MIEDTSKARWLIYCSQFDHKEGWKKAEQTFINTLTTDIATLCENVHVLVRTVFKEEDEREAVEEFILEHKVFQKMDFFPTKSICKLIKKVLENKYLSPDEIAIRKLIVEQDHQVIDQPLLNVDQGHPKPLVYRGIPEEILIRAFRENKI